MNNFSQLKLELILLGKRSIYFMNRQKGEQGEKTIYLLTLRPFS
jgi:hypothetical protein